MNGKAEGRWFGTSPCDNKRTIALRANALRAYEGKPSELIPPGPRSRVGAIQLNWVTSAYCPNVTYLLFGSRKALCCCCWCESNGRFYSSGRRASAGCWRSPSCKLGKPERWRPSRRLKPDVNVTIGGDRPPRLGGDVVTFEDMREFLVAYLEYEQQMHVVNEDGGGRVLARRRELVYSATQMMVVDEFYDGKPWIVLSEQEL